MGDEPTNDRSRKTKGGPALEIRSAGDVIGHAQTNNRFKEGGRLKVRITQVGMNSRTSESIRIKMTARETASGKKNAKEIVRESVNASENVKGSESVRKESMSGSVSVNGSKDRSTTVLNAKANEVARKDAELLQTNKLQNKISFSQEEVKAVAMRGGHLL